MLTTTTISGLVWALIAAHGFLKGQPIDWRLIAGLVGAIAAGIGGVVIATIYLETAVLQAAITPLKLLTCAGVFVAFGWLLGQPRLGETFRRPTQGAWLVSLLVWPCVVLEELLKGGGNSLIVLLLVLWRGQTWPLALGHLYLASAMTDGVTLAVMAKSVMQNLDAWYLTPSLLGAALGSAVGVHYGRRHPAFVRILYLGVGSAVCLYLFVEV